MPEISKVGAVAVAFQCFLESSALPDAFMEGACQLMLIFGAACEPRIVALISVAPGSRTSGTSTV